jgi:hypothetical protein
MSRAQGDAMLFRTLLLQLQREMRETERSVAFWRKQQERHLAEPLSSAIEINLERAVSALGMLQAGRSAIRDVDAAPPWRNREPRSPTF